MIAKIVGPTEIDINKPNPNPAIIAEYMYAYT